MSIFVYPSKEALDSFDISNKYYIRFKNDYWSGVPFKTFRENHTANKLDLGNIPFNGIIDDVYKHILLMIYDNKEEYNFKSDNRVLQYAAKGVFKKIPYKLGNVWCTHNPHIIKPISKKMFPYGSFLYQLSYPETKLFFDDGRIESLEEFLKH